MQNRRPRQIRALDWVCTFALCLIFATRAAGQSAITADNINDDHVKKAISALIESLASRIDPQRHWEPARTPSGESTRQGGGYTAIALLSLMQAGQSYQDPRWRAAVDYLANLEMQGTYAVTTRASLWSRLPARFNDHLARDIKWIIDGFNDKTGGWDYVQNPTAKYHDHSIRQFGALALWDATKRDIRINPNLWRRMELAVLESQIPDGGWNYKGEGPATGSMTAAGLATLYITLDLLHGQDAIKLGQSPATKHSQAIERGLAWMDRHFTAQDNPGKHTYFFYYLYGVERVGLASGYKFFAGKDWFREGAAEIVNRMFNWDSAAQAFTVKPAFGAAGRTDDVAFALMFLSRGRVPVAFNKLQFEGAWNNRPRDAANLVRWISENSETELNWQIVSLNGEPESWLDAAALYIASHEALPWIKDIGIDAKKFAQDVNDFLAKRASGELAADTKPPTPPDSTELSKMKRYLDMGGLIFAVNEGNQRRFAESMEEAGTFMYPQYEWRQLPDDHWAYRAHAPVKGRRPVLRGLSNGVRELIILSPGGDLPATFQRHDIKQVADYSTAANIYMYASELNRSRPRLAQHVSINSNTTGKTTSATIVRALHEGNWKPEPLALNAFASTIAHERGLDITVSDHPLSAIDALQPRPHLVLVSGIAAHAFTAAQINAIRKYAMAGGVIFFETPGGQGDFTASAEQMIAATFEQPIESLLRTRIVTGEGMTHAIDLTQIEYRPFTLQSFGTRETAPRLRGITLDDKIGPQMLFSREDITHALLDQPRWGISGYSPKSARELLANIVQHAVAASASAK